MSTGLHSKTYCAFDFSPNPHSIYAVWHKCELENGHEGPHRTVIDGNAFDGINIRPMKVTLDWTAESEN